MCPMGLLFSRDSTSICLKNLPNIQRLKFWIIFADNFCNLVPSVLNERLKDIYLSWFFGKSGKVIGGALV